MRWLWIDRIVELAPRERLVAIKNVTMAEEHLHDGTGDLPVMPASLIIEGMAQSAGLLVGHASGFREKVLLAKIQRAEFEREAVPGTTIRYTARLTRLDPQGASTEGEVELIDPHDGSVSPMGRVDLLFSHLDQNASGAEFGDVNFVFGEAFRTLLRLSGIDSSGGPIG